MTKNIIDLFQRLTPPEHKEVLALLFSLTSSCDLAFSKDEPAINRMVKMFDACQAEDRLRIALFIRNQPN